MKKLVKKAQEGLRLDKDGEYILNPDLPGSPENPIQLNEVTVYGRQPMSWWQRYVARPWNNAVNNFLEEDPIFGRMRVRNLLRILRKNPNALDNWDIARNVAEFTNIASAGLFNRFCPSQNVGLIIDTFLGDNVMDSWFGNSGIVSDNFAREHPYWAMAANGATDLATYSLLSRFTTTSRFNNPDKVYHSDKGNGTGFTGHGAYIKDGHLYPGQTGLLGQSNYTWWNEGEPFSPGFSFKRPVTRMVVADKDAVPGLIRVRDQNYRIGQWNPGVRKSFVRTSEMVSSEPLPMQSADVYRRIPRTEVWFRTSTSGPLGRYGLQDFISNPHIGSWSLNAPRSLLYSKKKIGYTNYPDTYFGEFPNSTFRQDMPPPHSRFGEFIGAGDEATVFRDNSDPSKVLKISNSAGAASEPANLSLQTIAPIMLKNKLPGSVKITPVGYGYSPGYKGYFPVFLQNFTHGILPETTFNFESQYMPRIAELLKKSGWRILGSEFTNGRFSAYDFLPQNVAEENGVFHFVDIPVTKITK